MSFALAVTSALILCSGFFFWVRTRTFLHIFQQEEYDTVRFVRWTICQRAYDKRVTALAVLIIIVRIGFHSSRVFWLTEAALAFGMLLVALRERNPIRTAKKKLVMTDRAKRLSALSSLLVWLGFVAIISFGAPTLFIILPLQIVPLSLCAAKWIFEPFEIRLRKKYGTEAADKLRNFRPVIIGITGSFGKTSVKHILGHILDMMSPTLITPGSVNTEMGISRIVRDRLRREHKYFVVEMGAYGPGSIARLCRLAPPKLAIITSIGFAHFERFKNLEVVAQTKFEIAEAALSLQGKIIVRSNVLDFEVSRTFASKHPGQFVICGELEADDCQITGIAETTEGLTCKLTWMENSYTLQAPLYGLHQGYNMVLAFVAACNLGFDPHRCAIALRTMPQISHRLEVTKQAGGWTLIDDSYNANSVGFESAISLLRLLASDSGRRILVTPGLVELGVAHDAEHFKIGEIAGREVDILLLIGKDRIPTFVDGFCEAARGRDTIMEECENLNQALDWVKENARHRDVVLIENDLPDLYEARLSI